MSRIRLHTYVQSSVSMEGLVDTLKKLFTVESKTKKAATPFSPEVDKFKWLKEAQSQAATTYANLDWVTKNLNSRELAAPKLAQELSYKGKVPKTPTEALANISTILNSIRTKVPAVEKYTAALRNLENEAESWPGDAETIGKRMLAAAGKINTVYKPGDTTPELFNGRLYQVTKHYTVAKRDNDNYRADGDSLSALTAEEIVKAVKTLFSLMDDILQLEDDRGLYPGSGCDSGVWDKFDYEDHEELWELMYFQSRPGVAKNMIMYPLWDLYEDTMFSIMKWIYSQVSKDAVSVESIDGNNNWVSYL